MTFKFLNLKLHSVKAINLIDEYTEMTTTWLMNKKHCKSVSFK